MHKSYYCTPGTELKELPEVTGFALDASEAAKMYASGLLRAADAICEAMEPLTIELRMTGRESAKCAASFTRAMSYWSRNRTLRAQHKLKARGKNWRAVK